MTIPDLAAKPLEQPRHVIRKSHESQSQRRHDPQQDPLTPSAHRSRTLAFRPALQRSVGLIERQSQADHGEPQKIRPRRHHPDTQRRRPHAQRDRRQGKNTAERCRHRRQGRDPAQQGALPGSLDGKSLSPAWPSSAAQSRPHRLDGAAQRFETDHLAVEAHSEHIMRKVHSMLAVPSRIARTLSGQPIQVAPRRLFIMPSTIQVTDTSARIPGL